MHINDILNIQDVRERSDSLRKCFCPYSELVDVTGSEASAVIALINLSVKKGTVEDLFSRKSAQQLLNDKKHLLSCIKEISWQHSHNLKHPDARVSGGRIMVSPPINYAGYISSNGLEKEFGWSHDSKTYNTAKMFCAAFLWNGRVNNLSMLLSEGHTVWRDAVRSLGLKGKKIEELVGAINKCLAYPLLPNEVSQFSPQVRFFYQKDYVAVTPVVSHAMMVYIQRQVRRKVCSSVGLSFRHSASIGDLAGSVGGHVNALYYPPRLKRPANIGLSEARIHAIMQGKHFFYKSCLSDDGFLAACEVLVNAKRFSTDRVRRQEKRYAASKIKSTLREWLSPVYEWREIFKGKIEDSSFELIDSLEWRISSLEGNTSPALVRELNIVLNEQLGSYSKARRFAYHHELMMPFKAILRGILKASGFREELVPKKNWGEGGRDLYVYLKNIQVYDALAMASPYLCGIPSLTALWGLTKEYEIKLNALSHTSLNFDGVAWFLREYQERGDIKIPSPTKLSRETGRLMRSGLMPARFCDMVMDVVIRVSDPDTELTTIDPQLLQAACPSRFAGGVLHPPILQDERHWCQVVEDKGLFKQLRQLPRSGRWVTPGSIQSNSLHETLCLCNKFSDLRPVSAGYALLEEPVERAGSVMKQHAFAESLISLAHLVSPIVYRLEGWEAFAQQAFWGMRSENRAMLMSKV